MSEHVYQTSKVCYNSMVCVKSVLYMAHLDDVVPRTSKDDPEGAGVRDEDLCVEEEETEHIPNNLAQHDNERPHHPALATDTR